MSRELFERFGKLVGKDYSHEAVIAAASNLILNSLRQKNLKLSSAQGELGELFDDMNAALRRDHYGSDGVRRGSVILGQPVLDMLRAERIKLP